MDTTSTNENSPPSVFALVGPTASGKTGVSLEVGAQCPIEVVNLDAMQIYRGMDIGTAKPTQEEFATVPHHLFDISDPSAQLGAGNYAVLASEVVSDILERGKIPFFVGGTGFYLRVLRKGLSPIPEIAAEVRGALKKELADQGLPSLRRELEACDPAWADQIHPNDTQRTLRGLEVFRGTGKTLSDYHKVPRTGALPQPMGVFVLDPPKEVLQERIEARVPLMLQNGLIEEVHHLLEAGLLPSSHAMGAPGYREVCQFINGELAEEELVTAIVRAHRAYAKRQRTFLATEEGILKVQHSDEVVAQLRNAPAAS